MKCKTPNFARRSKLQVRSSAFTRFGSGVSPSRGWGNRVNAELRTRRTCRLACLRFAPDLCSGRIAAVKARSVKAIRDDERVVLTLSALNRDLPDFCEPTTVGS